ncbi:MAG: tetratricopeptide repeat protein [Ignavibacteriales bacterium]|nr:tetratricopeptide repeat protein [Ignavibacteriales bacterium]
MQNKRVFGLLAFLTFVSLSAHLFGQSTTQPASIAEEQDYAFAYGLYGDGLFQIAGEQFDRFLEKYPSSLKRMDAYFLSIECRFQQQQFDTAARLFARFVKEYPSSRLSADAFLRLGEAYLRLKQPDQAVSSFKTILDKFGQSELAGEAAYWIGETFVQTSEYENAIKYYTLAYEHYQNNRLRDYALYGIGWTYQTKGEYGRAAEWYAKLRNEFPRSDLFSASLVRTGECSFYMKEFQKAIEELSASRAHISKTEERGEAEYLIGEAYFNLNEYGQARVHYEVFLREFPDHRLFRDVLYALGWTHLKTDNFAGAEETFDGLSAGNDPLAQNALFRRGVAEKFGGKRNESLETWKEVVRRFPAGEFSDNALYETGLVLYEDDKYPEARSQFDQLIRNYPQSDVLPEAYRMLGECLVAELRFDEAKKALAAATEFTGASFEVKTNALFQLGWCQIKLKEYGDAVRTMTRFLDLYPGHPKAVDARFWRAEARYQLYDYEGAFGDYESAGQPSGSLKREEALYGSGWSLYKLNEFGKAIVRFEQLLREFPGTKFLFDARLRLADSYFFAKDYKNAEGAYRSVIRQFSRNEGVDYAHYQLGQTYYRSGKYTDAVQQMSSLIRNFPSSSLADDAQYAIGWIWFQNKEYPEAIKEFQKLLQLFPQSDLAAKATYSIGDARYNRKDYTGAEQAYRQVLEKFPQSQYVGDAMTGIQYCLLAQGKPEEALRVIDSFVRENPRSSMAEILLLKKGDLYFSQEQYDAAVREYRTFADQYPESPQAATAYYWIGRSYLAQERLLDAATAFERAAGLSKGVASVVGQSILEAGEVYRSLKSYEKALEVLSKAEKMNAGAEVVSEAMVRKGAIYEATGDLASALQQYNMVISANSRARSADKARVSLARLYMRETNYTDGHRLAADVATSRTDELGAEAQYVIGLIYSAQRDWQSAATAFLKVRYVFPSQEEWLAKAYLGLGNAYERMNDHAKAREAYRTVLKLERQKESVAEAQQRLKSLERP